MVFFPADDAENDFGFIIGLSCTLYSITITGNMPDLLVLVDLSDVLKPSSPTL